MTETAVSTATGASDTRPPGLFSRVIGVLFSPRATYAAVAARPRALGALMVTAAIMIACQTAFMSTETGRAIVLEQQVRTMESFGMTVSDEMYSQMESRLQQSQFINPVVTLAFVPLMNAIVAGLLMVIFTMLLGGNATFKHVYAIVAHSSIVIAVQQLFSTPLSYASDKIASATLSVFVPMFEENSFIVRFLGALDLFIMWWLISVAIGVGVLYRRRTGPVAVGLLTLYVLIALVLAAIRS